MWETIVGYTGPCCLKNCTAQKINIYIYIYINKYIQECKTLHTCSSDTIGKSFCATMQWKNSNIVLSGASCTNGAMTCARLAGLFFKLSNPDFTTLCRRWHPQWSQSHWSVVLKALATLPPQSLRIVGKSTYNLNKWHCSTATLATTVRTQQSNN